MNNKSITKLLETVAFSNGVYVLWNLYDGNIHISIRQEISRQVRRISWLQLKCVSEGIFWELMCGIISL